MLAQISVSQALCGLTYLDRAVTVVGDTEPDPFASSVDNDSLLFRDYSPWHLFARVLRLLDDRELIRGGYR